MTPALRLLDDLDDLGFTARVVGDRLLVAPLSELPEATLARLREHRAAVVDVLRYGTVVPDGGVISGWEDDKLVSAVRCQRMWETLGGVQ